MLIDTLEASVEIVRDIKEVLNPSLGGSNLTSLGRESMKSLVTSAIAACSLAMMLVVGSVDDASAACKGRTAQRTGPNGTVTVCLDGSYQTCVRDARARLGWG